MQITHNIYYNHLKICYIKKKRKKNFSKFFNEKKLIIIKIILINLFKIIRNNDFQYLVVAIRFLIGKLYCILKFNNKLPPIISALAM